MLTFLRDPVKRGYATMGILALLAVALLAPLVVNADARHLSAYRDGPEDLSAAREALAGRASRVEAYLSTAHQLDDVEDAGRTLLVIVGAERRYSESETAAVLSFLRRGGNVILADEGGFGTDIAREAGFAFSGLNLLDTQNHLDDPTLGVATSRLDGRDYRLLFNQPSALVPLPTAGEYTVLARSSAAEYPDGSFLDRDEDEQIDIDDTPGPWPLVVRTQVGDGQLILVADTGLFMNQQARVIEFDNDDYVAALAAQLVPRDGLIILDESRHAPAPAVALYANAVRTLGRATSGPIAPLVTLVALLAVTALVWRSTRETEDWSHHEHDLGRSVPVPEDLRPDLDRAQRMARRRISERFNIPLEQVAAMPAEELLRLTGDRTLAEAAAGTLKSDPAPLFPSFSPEARSE